jgi:hypothetical protein
VKSKVLTIYRINNKYFVGLGEKEIINIVCDDNKLIDCVKKALEELPLEYHLESEDL